MPRKDLQDALRRDDYRRIRETIGATQPPAAVAAAVKELLWEIDRMQRLLLQSLDFVAEEHLRACKEERSSPCAHLYLHLSAEPAARWREYHLRKWHTAVPPPSNGSAYPLPVHDQGSHGDLPSEKITEITAAAERARKFKKRK